MEVTVEQFFDDMQAKGWILPDEFKQQACYFAEKWAGRLEHGSELTRDDLLVILIEEAGEVIQAATKCLRFGYNREQAGYGVNHEVLASELGDLLGVMGKLPLNNILIQKACESKIARATQAKRRFGRVSAADATFLQRWRHSPVRGEEREMADQLEYLQRIAYEAYDRGFIERDKKMKLHTFSGFVANYWPAIEKSCAWAKEGAAAPSLPSVVCIKIYRHVPCDGSTIQCSRCHQKMLMGTVPACCPACGARFERWEDKSVELSAEQLETARAALSSDKVSKEATQNEKHV